MMTVTKVEKKIFEEYTVLLSEGLFELPVRDFE